MWFSLPQTFQPASPYNPYQTFYTTLYGLSTELTTRFTRLTPYASLAWVSKPIPSSHLVPPLRFHFFQSHTNIPYVTAHHTFNLYFFHIRCSNAVTTFETSRIYNKTISKFIPRNHYDQETWTFWWDSQIMFSYLFQNSDAYSLTQHRPPPNIGFHSYSEELVYMCSCYKFVCPLFTQES